MTKFVPRPSHIPPPETRDTPIVTAEGAIAWNVRDILFGRRNTMTVYRYYVPDDGQTTDDCFEFELPGNWDEEPNHIASEAADDYFNEHDGWDSAWPRDIVVFLTDGREVRCSVSMETEPVFYASVYKE